MLHSLAIPQNLTLIKISGYQKEQVTYRSIGVLVKPLLIQENGRAQCTHSVHRVTLFNFSYCVNYRNWPDASPLSFKPCLQNL